MQCECGNTCADKLCFLEIKFMQPWLRLYLIATRANLFTLIRFLRRGGLLTSASVFFQGNRFKKFDWVQWFA